MRKGKVKKRILLPDPVYGDRLVTRFVNNMTLDGKKSIAYRIFYSAIDMVAEKTSEDGLEVWKTALSNVGPAVEVKSRRVGGATFQVPIEVRPNRKMSLSMKWLIRFAKLRHEKDTRHAAISIYDAKEHKFYSKDTPCTYAIQFTIVDNRLNMAVLMRSNDLWYGFCNDQYCFSMIQKLIADRLDIKVGEYYHYAHNLHLYKDKI